MNDKFPYDIIINSDTKDLEEYLQNLNYSSYENEFLINNIIGASLYLENEKLISFLIKFVKKNKLSIGKREVIEGIFSASCFFPSIKNKNTETDYYINLMYIEPYSSVFG